MDTAVSPALPPYGASAPSPTPSLTMTSSATASPVLRPSNLDELLDDCFQVFLGQHTSLCDTRVSYAISFDKFLTSLHCHENLAFLMEIFKYEYFYGKVFPQTRSLASTDVMSSGVLNLSLSSTIDSLPFPTRKMSRTGRRHSRSRSRTSSMSGGGRPSSSVFDLGFEEHFETENVWDKLKDQHIDSSDSESESDSDCDSELDNNKLLQDQWSYIINQFVLEDSPQQLNLANCTVKNLMEKDAQDCIQNPSVLLPAKEEIIQLLRENVYGTFLSQFKSRANSATTSAAASRAHSRAHSPHPEENSSACTAVNCCHSSINKLLLHNSGLPQSHTPLGRNSPKCHSPSPLQQSTARSIPAKTSLVNAEANSDSSHEVVAPVPLVKRKTSKFFPHVGGSNTPNESSGSEFSLSSIMSHFKSPSSPSNTPHRSLASPHPKTASAITSELSSPLLSDAESSLRPVSTGEACSSNQGHSYRFGKIWRRRK